MEFNDIADALRKMPRNFAFRIANAARPNADYKFNDYLPEMNMMSYEVGSSTMRIIATMAGLVGMDSPFPEGGQVTLSTFKEGTAKIANHVTLPEKAIRELQHLLMYLRAQGVPTTTETVNTILNFENKLVVQPHLDTMEMLRGQAIMRGYLDWTFGKIHLKVDYGIPAGNKKVYAGANGFGGSTSQFWAFIRTSRTLLKNNVREYIAHPDTVDMIVTNPDNHLEIIGGNQQDTFQVQRVVGSLERASTDKRDTVTLYAYGGEASVIDPARPGETLVLPFCPRGAMAAIGNNAGTPFNIGSGAVGVGSTEPIENTLGYTHLGPTVEGGGAPGRWSKVRTDEDRPYNVEGEGVTNGLPVVEENTKLVLATTDMG